MEIRQIISIRRERTQTGQRRLRNHLILQKNRLSFSQPQTLLGELSLLSNQVQVGQHLDSLQKLNALLVSYDRHLRTVPFHGEDVVYSEEDYLQVFTHTFDRPLITCLMDVLAAYEQPELFAVALKVMVNLCGIYAREVDDLLLQLQVMQLLYSLLELPLPESQIIDVFFGLANIAQEVKIHDSQQLQYVDYQTILEIIAAHPESPGIQENGLWLLSQLFHPDNRIGVTLIAQAYQLYNHALQKALPSLGPEHDDLIGFISGMTNYANHHSIVIDFLLQHDPAFCPSIIGLLNQMAWVEETSPVEAQEIVLVYLKLLYQVANFMIRNHNVSLDDKLTIGTTSLQYLLCPPLLIDQAALNVHSLLCREDRQFYLQLFTKRYDVFQKLVYSMRGKDDESLKAVLKYFYKVSFYLADETLPALVKDGLLAEYMQILGTPREHSCEILMMVIDNLSLVFAQREHCPAIQESTCLYDTGHIITHIFNNGEGRELQDKADEFMSTFMEQGQLEEY